MEVYFLVPITQFRRSVLYAEETKNHVSGSKSLRMGTGLETP